MTKKILLAGLLGGLILFLWESLAHMVLPLGEAGIQALGNEQAVIAALKENVKAPGFYFFPAPESKSGMTKEQQQEAIGRAEEKFRTGPSGIMVIRMGVEMMTPRQFLTQFLGDVAAMVIAALLLAQMPGLAGFGRRLLFLGLMSLIPTLRSELPLWNWYGFPGIYLAAQFTVQLVGFLAAGLVMAKLVKPSEPRP